MRKKRSLIEDERAIEGLPIRLVIALVVGVAALGLMMGILNGFAFAGQEEVDVKPDKSIISEGETVTLTVVTDDGEPVEGARVLALSGTLSLDSPIENGGGSSGGSAKTGSEGEAKITVESGDTEFRTNQDQGTIKFDVKVPGDSGFVDNSPNTKITVLRDD